VAWVLAAAWLAAGCAVQQQADRAAALAVGADAAQVAALGRPSASYALAGGARRLEFATGPYGRETWMVDVDAGGRVAGVRQVLGERSFLALQTRIDTEGLDAAGLRRELGTPGEIFLLARGMGEVWNWRYPTNDCLWFQATVDAQGRVKGTGYGPDPRCEARSDSARP
jgi:hypothetical protein